MTQPIDVDRLVGLIEDAAIRYAGGVPVDFRPTAKEIAALVLEDAAKQFDTQPHVEMFRPEVAEEIRALAKGVE